jgi:GH24 family phage-related lysozyme (muramidase)
MAGLDTNKISNILGTKIPQWLIRQLDLRSIQNTQDQRDNSNLLFVANKSAWIRLVSSIDIINPPDQLYFNIVDQSDLAKQYVLFGGTSKYLNSNSYGLRSGLGKDGAYGTLGTEEIQKYGYRPMPGITNVTIDTLGKLGSLRQATINFKCWDKAQLDIIDALYFKLGFTMFLEWGNTFFYSSENPNVLQSSELYSIDPFRQNLTKEEIAIQISKNSRASEGNYDALLGLVTNFNFTYNQDGGFDCTIKLTGLGILGDSTKINNPKDLPNILAEEIRLYNNTLLQIATAEERAKQAEADRIAQQQRLAEEASKQSLLKYLNKAINRKDQEPTGTDLENINKKAGIRNSTSSGLNTIDYVYDINDRGFGPSLIIPRLGALIPTNNTENIASSAVIDVTKLFSRIEGFVNAYTPPQDVQQLLTTRLYAQFSTSDKMKLASIKRQTASRVKQQYLLTFSYPGIFSNPTTNTIPDYPISIEVSFDNRNPQFPREPFDDVDIYNKAINELKNASILSFNIDSFVVVPVNSANPQFIGRTFPNSVSATDPDTKRSRFPILTLSTEVNVSVIGKQTNVSGNIEQTETIKDNGSWTLPVTIILNITDTDLINSIVRGAESPDFKVVQDNISSQNQTNTTESNESTGQDPSITQIKQALESQSSLELTLRTIQVHALNKAINDNKKSLDIGRLVYTLEIASEKDRTSSGVTFYNQIFSNGIFSDPVITDLIKNTNINIDPKNPKDRFKLQAKYGFATELMSGRKEVSQLAGKEVNFSELLRAYVVPYEINQEIIKGTSTNHPVYIPLGLLLMILNHNCTIYDTKDLTTQTPLVYIDFNPNLNFFLSNKKHLSTNPWVTLIRYEGDFSDYQDLFSKEILSQDQTAIAPLSGSNETTPLFKTPNEDLLSPQIPPIKFDNTTNNVYRGKLMNVLLSIDYLVKLVRDYSLKDGSNNIYLKTFLEQIISDVNKYLGNFNLLRVSYNDGGNTYQIVDDQVVPPLDEEEILGPNDVTRDNTSEIPLLGKFSIAKNLEIKTDISNQLANMIAISANADVANKATLSSNGDNFGFINTSYKDRYIPVKGDINSNARTGSVSLDSAKASAIQFNQSISDFYSKINPSEANVSHATNYYIEKMSKIKNNEYPTRASTMIPVSVNFTTDGISGLVMGQGFTISDELLPYTYNNRIVRGVKGLEKDHINKVGFVVVGLTNTIENNQWNTSVRANMIFLKDKTEFVGSVKALEKKNIAFGENPNNIPSNTIGQVSLGDININQSWEQIAFDFISKKEGFLEKPKNDEGTLRAGYGTDKIVLADGTVKSVGSDTVFTREDGKRTLIYQIKTTFTPTIIRQIGKEAWDSLNDKQKAALVSFTYNAGSLTRAVVSAIKSNTGSTTVANAIIEGPKTGKVSGYIQALEQRRKEEASLYLS